MAGERAIARLQVYFDLWNQGAEKLQVRDECLWEFLAETVTPNVLDHVFIVLSKLCSKIFESFQIIHEVIRVLSVCFVKVDHFVVAMDTGRVEG